MWLNNEVEAARLDEQDPAEAARRRATAMQARESMLAGASETEA